MGFSAAGLGSVILDFLGNGVFFSENRSFNNVNGGNKVLFYTIFTKFS